MRAISVCLETFIISLASYSKSSQLANFPNDFFFGVANAPAQVEDNLDDAWLRWAEDGRVRAFYNYESPEKRINFWTNPEREIIEAKKSGDLTIEVWGDGEQTRSFMYIDDCITGLDKLMNSDFSDPINLGRSELVSINQMIDMISEIAGVEVERVHNLDAPQGVRGRNSDNTLILEKLGWEPEVDLRTGLAKTYAWIEEQVEKDARGETVVS